MKDTHLTTTPQPSSQTQAQMAATEDGRRHGATARSSSNNLDDAADMFIPKKNALLWRGARCGMFLPGQTRLQKITALLMILLQCAPIVVIVVLLFLIYSEGKKLSKVDTRWTLLLNMAQCIIPLGFLQVLSQSNLLRERDDQESNGPTRLAHRLINWLARGAGGWQKRNIVISVVPSLAGIIAEFVVTCIFLTVCYALFRPVTIIG